MPLHMCLCVYTHTHTNTLTLEQLFPEKKKSKSLLIYLADRLRTLVKGRIPSAPKRSWRSHSHLHPPFFLATGNIPSYWVEGVDSEVKCHALVAGSPGAGLYTSRRLNILKKWVLIPGLLTSPGGCGEAVMAVVNMESSVGISLVYCHHNGN